MEAVENLLDTDICVEILRTSGTSASRWFERVEAASCAVSAVTAGELLYGVARHPKPEVIQSKTVDFLSMFRVIDFGLIEAEHYARIRAELAAAGTPIGANDLLIAATALASDLAVATGNRREFARVRGLRLVDFEDG